MKAIVWPCFSVAGILPPEIENPAPLIDREVIVAAAVPVEVAVTDLVTDLPTATLPNASDEVLRVSDGAVDLEAFR